MRFALFAALIAAASLAPAQDWPHWRGPNADGISPEKGINKSWATKPPKLVWKVDMTDQGHSGPIVVDGTLYIVDHQGGDDVVKALSMATGSEIWHYCYPDPRGYDNGFARATPAYDKGKLYTTSQTGTVNCIDAKSGKLVWTKHLVKDFGGRPPGWFFAPSPVIDGDKLILVPGAAKGSVVAVNKNTGELIWRGGGSDLPGYATPVIARINATKQYVVFLDKTLAGLNPDTGAVIWSFPYYVDPGANIATPLVMGNSVYITSSYNHGCVLVDVSGSKADARWQNKAMMAHMASPVFYNGYIYGSGDPGDLICIDPKSGKAMWKQPGFEKGGMVAVDGVLLALNGSNGDLVMVELNPTAYKELGRSTPLGNRSWTAPIVAEGRIIVRNRRSLACLELK